MRLAANPTQTAMVIEHIRASFSDQREPGTHVSDLTGCLRKAWARKHGVVEQELDPSTVLLFATGRAIQDYITGGSAKETEVRLQWEGIHGTVDSVTDGVPVEVKATYVSAASDPVARSPHYFDQLASYCLMLGATLGHLAIFYINGYYDFMRKKPREDAKVGERSVLKVFDVHFGLEELMRWSGELVGRRQRLEAAKNLEDIPLDDHYTWECDFCPLKGRQCPGGPGTYDARSVVSG